MSIVFRCSHCDAAFAAPAGLAGRRARCRGCRGVVQVPLASVPLALIVPPSLLAAPSQTALMPLAAGTMPGTLVPAQPSLEPMRPDDPLLELLGPRRPAHGAGLAARWIVGGGVGLACAIIVVALFTWTVNRVWQYRSARAVVAAPPARGFVIEPPQNPFTRSAPRQPTWRSESDRPPSNPFVEMVPPPVVSPAASDRHDNEAGRRRSSAPIHSNGSSSAASSGSDVFVPPTPIPGPSASRPSDEPAAWSLQPDPPAEPLELKEGDFKAPLSGPQPQIVFPAMPSRFVLAWSGDNSRPDCTMYDLKTGQAVGKKIPLFGLQPDKALVSDDGRYVAMPRLDEGREQHRLRIASVSFATGEPQPRIELKCTEFHKAQFGASHQLITAHALGERYSSNQTHVLTLWDVQTGESIREIDLYQLDAGHRPQLKFFTVSPGGRYAAYPCEDEIVFIDLQEGKVAGRLPLSDEARGQARLTFSPDGKLLASIEGSFRADLRVFDMATGKLAVDERIETGSFGLSWQNDELSWLPENRGLFVGGQVLLELTSAREAWRFPRSRGEPRRIYRDGEMITLGADRNRFYLYSAPLPQKQMDVVFDALRVRTGTGIREESRE